MVYIKPKILFADFQITEEHEDVCVNSYKDHYIDINYLKMLILLANSTYYFPQIYAEVSYQKHFLIQS